MSRPTNVGVFWVVDRYRELEQQWHALKADFDWFVAMYGDATGAIPVEALATIKTVIPNHERTSTVYVESILYVLQTRMDIINEKKAKLDLIIDNCNVTIPPDYQTI